MVRFSIFLLISMLIILVVQMSVSSEEKVTKLPEQVDTKGIPCDDDEYEDDHDEYRSRKRYENAHRSGYKRNQYQEYKVQNKLYLTECGSCHFAYQPELLPKRSWSLVMAKLDNHFKTDASLDKSDQEKISNYLQANAGDAKPVYNKHIRKLLRSIYPNETPIRLSSTRYFMREHREIPRRLINQKEVKSLAHCNKCHNDAESGRYSENDIYIPNYGRWDD